MIQNSLSIPTVLDVWASVRCTQFLLIQGFWSCFTPQICGLFMEDIISTTPLWLLVFPAYMHVDFVHVFKYLHHHIHDRGKKRWLIRGDFSLIYSASTAVFLPLLCWSPRSPSRIEGGGVEKKILDQECLTTGKFTWKGVTDFQHVKHDLSVRLWHLLLMQTSQRRLGHSQRARFSSVSRVSKQNVKKVQRKLSVSLLVAGPQTAFEPSSYL